jgi:hypothetical protein
MLRWRLLRAGLITTAVTFSASSGYAQEFYFVASLNGFEELGSLPSATAFPTGAILSNGTGFAELLVNRSAGLISYTLTYDNVGTTAPLTGTVTQAHIHFGKSRDSGGIMVFFCTNLGNAPAGTPPCPVTSGIVTGIWTGASVVGPATQNVVAGNFNALLQALDSDTAYANIHTTALGAGEIRGQIHPFDQEFPNRP